MYRHLLVGNVHDIQFGKVGNGMSQVSENSCRQHIPKGSVGSKMIAVNIRLINF